MPAATAALATQVSSEFDFQRITYHMLETQVLSIGAPAPRPCRTALLSDSSLTRPLLFFASPGNPASIPLMVRLKKSRFPRGCRSLSLSAAGVVLLAIATAAPSQEPAASPPPAPKADYSAGFSLLLRAGLLDLKDWKYIQFKSEHQYQDDSWREALQLQKLTGNAWLDPKTGPDGLRRITHDGLTIVAVAEKMDESFSSLNIAARKEGMELRVGKISEANEAADATLLAPALATAVKDENVKDIVLQSKDQVAMFLFMAAHLHRRGQTAPANQITQTLLNLLPRKEALIEAAVESLADHRLQQYLARFKAGHDWKALQTGLESLIADFPKSWPARPVAERLLTQVKPRATGQPPPPVSTTASALTDEQKVWWAKVTDYLEPKDADNEASPPDFQRLAYTWFIRRSGAPEGTMSHYVDPVESTPQELFDASKDWDWIALMAAGLGDLTLTNLSGRDGDFYGSRMYGGSFDPEAEPEEWSDEQIEEHWQSLDRPLTRDDIARTFLGVVLPLSHEGRGSRGATTMDVEELKDAAKSWSAKVAGKKDADFARLYLKEGSETHIPLAASILASTGNEADLAQLEELVLNNPAQGLEIATQILQKRKAAGKPFFDKFKAKYLAQIKEMYGADEPDEKKREARVPDYMRSQLSALDGLVSGKGLTEAVKEYVEGKMDDTGMRTTIQTLGNDYKWTQQEVELLFTSASEVPKTDDARRFLLLTTASQAAYKVMSPEAQAPRGGLPWARPATPEGETPPPDWLRVLFRDAITQNRDVKITAWEEGPLLGQYTCYLLDSLWDRATAERLRIVLDPLPREDFWPYLESRAMARLEGKPVPPLPDATKVPEARKQELKAAIKKVGEGGWLEFFSTLNLDEKVAMQAELAGTAFDPAWRKNLLTITEVVLSGAPEARPEPWRALQGRTVDAALLQSLMEQSQLALKEGGKDLHGTLVTRSHLRGMRLRVGDAPANAQRGQPLSRWLASRDPEVKDPAIPAASFVRQDSHALVSLLGKDGKWTPQPDDAPPSGFRSPPFRGVTSPDLFSKAITEWLEQVDLKQHTITFQFGASNMPMVKE